MHDPLTAASPEPAPPAPACKVCRSSEVGPSERFPAPALFHCSACDADFYAGPVSSSELYSHAYFEGDEYFSYAEDEPVHQVNSDRKIARLLGHSGPPRVVVEIGCAYGFFLRRVAERFPGATCIGIDVSRDVVAAARARGGGVHYFVADELDAFLAFARGRQVDWLVAWDTFEHLPDAGVFLRYVEELAAPGTLCALTTIDAGGLVPRLRGTRWRQFHPPTHVLYPTRRTLSHLASTLGWRVLRHDAFGYHRAARQYLAVARRLVPKPLWPSCHRILMKPPFGAAVYLNLYDIDMLVFRPAPRQGRDGGRGGALE